MVALQRLRGFSDFFPEYSERRLELLSRAQRVAALYGYRPVETPILESKELFVRSFGMGSDVISKELYSFPERRGEEVVLRPDGTAGLVRAVLAEGRTWGKYWYAGPMFRHERPQKGRGRQFLQFGLEYIGEESWLADVDVVLVCADFLKSIDYRADLVVNSLGSPEERKEYVKDLVSYLQANVSKLSAVSRRRLESNPLRILDSKESEDRIVLKGAPSIHSYLQEKSLGNLRAFCTTLRAMGVSVREDVHLVRGMDYYDGIVFEFLDPSRGEGQDSVIAGGRYDVFASLLGERPSFFGVGAAIGVDRLLAFGAGLRGDFFSFALVPVTSEDITNALKLSEKLRDGGISVTIMPPARLKRQLQKAEKRGLRFVGILGEVEHESGSLTVRDLQHGREEKISVEVLVTYLKEFSRADCR